MGPVPDFDFDRPVVAAVAVFAFAAVPAITDQGSWAAWVAGFVEVVAAALVVVEEAGRQYLADRRRLPFRQGYYRLHRPRRY